MAKVLALGLVLVAAVSGFAAPSQSRLQGPSAMRSDPQARELQRAMTEHHCTTTGFGDAASPLSALIRRDGELIHVTFERAWSVFTGAAPGRLLAVCLAER